MSTRLYVAVAKGLGLLLILLAPALLTQCASTPSEPIADITGELRTPETSLPHSEYPFDESGKYREDWVPGSGRRRSRH